MKISDSKELFNQSAMHFLAVIISLVKANFTKILIIEKNWKPSQVAKAKYKISSAKLQMNIFTATTFVHGFKVLTTQNYINIFK